MQPARRLATIHPSRPACGHTVHKHMGLCRKLLGPAVLVKPEVDKAADPSAPFVCIGHLYFKSMEEFQNGFFPHAAAMTADIANFTDVTPQVQISEIE